jgi:hypothetical protein
MNKEGLNRATERAKSSTWNAHTEAKLSENQISQGAKFPDMAKTRVGKGKIIEIPLQMSEK